MATGVITSAWAQQGTVPKWYQASASASSQLLKSLQVGGLLSSELWLHTIASHLLCAKGCKTPAKEAAGVIIHNPEGSGTIGHPPAGMNGAASPKLAAVTLAGGGTALIQGLELHIQAVQGSSGAGSGWGRRKHQKNCGKGCHWGSCWRPARAGGARRIGRPCWGWGWGRRWGYNTRGGHHWPRGGGYRSCHGAWLGPGWWC